MKLALLTACSEKFAVGDTDMTSKLGKCKAAGVDTVVVWSQGIPSAQLLRSMEKIDYFPVVLLVDFGVAIDDQAIIHLSGFAMAGPEKSSGGRLGSGW